jgi:hypothetical protein
MPLRVRCRPHREALDPPKPGIVDTQFEHVLEGPLVLRIIDVRTGADLKQDDLHGGPPVDSVK